MLPTNTLTIALPDGLSDYGLAQLRAVIAEEIAAAQTFTRTRDEAWLWTPLRLADAARFLGIAADELSRLASAGLVPVSYALGPRSPRYLRGELVEWLRDNRRGAAVEAVAA